MSGFGRRVVTMASGTMVSRATGLVRVLVLAWVLGFSPLADAFNLANTVPNMLFDLVLGGMVSATFIPVFVERLALDGERRAWRSISSVVTVSLLVLLLATLLTWAAAPWIIQGFTFLHRSHGLAHVQALARQRSVATQFLRWFAPQIFFYGVIGIATALLNIRQRFAAASWAPVANNLVCIAVLVWFHLVDPSPTVASLDGTKQLMWLGLGTSAGVALQFGLLLPSLNHHSVSRLRFRLDLSDIAVRTIARLSGWTLGVVVANQVSLYVVLALAFGVGGNGPVSAYTYGWSFMQMPYAVVVVSVLSVLTPQLAMLAAANDLAGLARRLGRGLSQSLHIVLPIAIAMVVLAQPIVGILLNHGVADRHLLAGIVLAILAAGLPGFTVFQLCIRGLQAQQRARDVFALYVAENVLTVVVGVAFGRHSLAGLTAGISLAYTISALLAVVVLSHNQVSLWPALAEPALRRTLLGSLVMGLLMAMAYASLTWSSGVGLLVRTATAVLAGGSGFGAIVWVGPRWRLRRNV